MPWPPAGSLLPTWRAQPLLPDTHGQLGWESWEDPDLSKVSWQSWALTQSSGGHSPMSALGGGVSELPSSSRTDLPPASLKASPIPFQATSVGQRVPAPTSCSPTLVLGHTALFAHRGLEGTSCALHQGFLQPLLLSPAWPSWGGLNVRGGGVWGPYALVTSGV